MSSGDEERSDSSKSIADLLRELVRRTTGGDRVSKDQLLSEHPEAAEQLEKLIPTLHWLDDKPELQSKEASIDNDDVPRVLGDFELGREIGRGGMGIVYEAKQISLQKRVALKVLPFAGVLDQRMVKRFRNEAMAAAQLEHPHIVPVYHVGHERGVHYFAMQYIEGRNLAQLIHELDLAASGVPIHSGKGSDTPTEAFSSRASAGSGGQKASPALNQAENVDSKPSSFSGDLLQLMSRHRSTTNSAFLAAFVKLGIEVADALQHAHEMGVVHRDIKPSNLLLDVQGNAWLADFGLALIQGDSGLTFTGDIIGTLRYMSPEQALAKRVVVDHRTDIYSLGVTLYELLTLQQAFQADSREQLLRLIAFEEPLPPRRINRRIPDELEIIVTKALAKNPDERYQTAGELADDLRHFRNNEPISAKRPTVVQRVTKWSRRHHTLVVSGVVGASIIFIAAIAAAMVSWGYYRDAKAAHEGERAQRQETQRTLAVSEGLRLVANSTLELSRNPGLALLLGIEGAKRHPGREANNALTAAMAANHEHRTLIGHDSPIGSARYSSDGTKIVTTAPRSWYARGPEPARVWDAESGQQLLALKSETTITSAVFSPDGGRILACSSPTKHFANDDVDGTLTSQPPILFDVATGTKLAVLTDAFLFDAHPAALSSDGRKVVTPSLGHVAKVWDCIAGLELVTLKGHTRRVVYAAFSPDDTMVVTISDDNTVRIWDAQTGTELAILDYWSKRNPRATSSIVNSAVFSPNNKQLLTGSELGGHLWDIATNTQVGGRWSGDIATFVGDGALVLTHFLSGGNISVHSPTGATLFSIDGIYTTSGNVAVSPDGSLVASWERHDVRIWNAETGSPECTLGGHSKSIKSVVFSPDGTRIVSASDDGTARVWNLDSGEQRDKYDVKIDRSGKPVLSYSKSAREFLAVTKPRLHTTVWDVTSNKVVLQSLGRSWQTDNAETRLVTASGPRVVLRDLLQDTRIASFESKSGRVIQAILSPNGDTVLIAIEDGPIWLWRPSDGQRIALAGYTSDVRDAKYSLDGQQVIVGDESGNVRIWSVDTADLLLDVREEAAVSQVNFGPQGNRILVTTATNEVYVRDAISGEQTAKLAQEGLLLNRAQFTRDGHGVITYHRYDGNSVHYWNIETVGLGVSATAENVTGLVSVSLSPSHSEVIITSEQVGAIIWDYKAKIQRTLTDTPTAHGIFMPDGDRIVTATASQRQYPHTSQPGSTPSFVAPTLETWQADTGTRLDSTPVSIGRIYSMKSTPQTGMLLLNAHQYEIGVFDVKTHREIVRLAGHSAPISTATFLNHKRQIVTTSWDQTAAVWDIETGIRQPVLPAQDGPITDSAVNVREDLLATCTPDGTCRIWRVGNGEQIDTFDFGSHQLQKLRFSNDGSRLLASSSDGFKLWELGSGVIKSQISKSDDFLMADLSPDGKKIVAVDRKHGVRLFDINAPSGDTIRHDSTPVFATFSDQGDRVATLTSDGIVRVWDSTTRERLLELRSPSSSPTMARFLPGDQGLLTGGDGQSQLWNLETGTVLMDLLANRTNSIPLIHPHGTRAVTILPDLGLRSWTLQPLVDASEIKPRDLTELERRRYQLPSAVAR